MDGSNFTSASGVPSAARAMLMASSSASPDFASSPVPTAWPSASMVSPRVARPASAKARTRLTLAASRPAPLVKSPLSSIRPAPSRSATPLVPNLSSLSSARRIVRRTVSSVAPTPSKTALSKRRVLTRMANSPSSAPAARMASAAIAIISASAWAPAAPTVSASHCKNSRNRPGPGFSFRQTGPAA